MREIVAYVLWVNRRTYTRYIVQYTCSTLFLHSGTACEIVDRDVHQVSRVDVSAHRLDVCNRI